MKFTAILEATTIAQAHAELKKVGGKENAAAYAAYRRRRDEIREENIKQEIIAGLKAPGITWKKKQILEKHNDDWRSFDGTVEEFILSLPEEEYLY